MLKSALLLCAQFYNMGKSSQKLWRILPVDNHHLFGEVKSQFGNLESKEKGNYCHLAHNSYNNELMYDLQ
ncbi:hypothetical protein FGO68_gene8188 [Halteria grandinella]|uniref:Uncharacterized protein n=1 Tax=Halteria grandinella TaxID=5974 RepID=A0A8J8P445_HALGN|nr:hypothetical protein FGO68_gene8188 [Halteria grandinella]